MIISQGTTRDWPAQQEYRHLASASDTKLEVLPHSVPMLEQGGDSADDADAAPSQPREARSRRRRRTQVTVLVIDDEEPVRETVVEVLSFHGYRVITAASVGEAEAAKQQVGIEGLHLVIADVHLTAGRQIRAGYVLAQRWQAERPDLPIILISGDRSNEDLPEVQAGALRFLPKPFGMEGLMQAVREALGR